MASDATLRDTLNQAEPGRMADSLRDVQAGELINMLLNAATATQAGVTVTSNVATLSGTPNQLFRSKVASVSSGAATGEKTVLKVSDSFQTANDPPAGSCFWSGGTKVKFSSSDAAATADFLYSKASDATAAYLLRKLGQQNG